MPDPAAATGSDAQIALAFADVYRMLNNRIGIFTSLPMKTLGGMALQKKVDEISRVQEVSRAANDQQVQAIPPEDPASQPLFDTLIAWLEAANLPVDDLADDQPRYFVLRADDGRPLAFGGLSGAAPDLLLRSFVVDPTARDQGLGARLLAALSTIAASSGAERLWLLTTGTAPWFEAAGWRRVDRTQAPPTIANTGQFTRVCPASAVLLVRSLVG